MKKQGFIAILIFTVLLIMFSPTRLFADSWDTYGNYSITWFNKNQSEFKISTSKELAGVAYLVNNGYTSFKNVTIKIEGDIQLNGKTWKSIGINNTNYFQGTLDGQGHTISGLSITRESGDNNYFGFFGYISSATIKNITLIGSANVTEKTKNNLSQAVGGLAGSAINCKFERCICEMDISYVRNKTGAFDDTYWTYVGGMIGDDSKSTLSYCSHQGPVSSIFGTSPDNGEYYKDYPRIFIGGLVGASSSKLIEFCENVSTVISSEAEGSRNKSELLMQVGGIAGNSSAKIICSKNTGDFRVMFNGTKYSEMHIGGITGHTSNTIHNCFSTTQNIKVGAGSSVTNVYYGGIYGKVYSSPNFKANYSCSNLSISQVTLGKIKGFDGAITFSSDEMKSDNFLNELNVYPFLEFGEAVWTRDNDFPYIANLRLPSAIKPIVNCKRNNVVYSITGQKRHTPQKGINIIGNKKIYKR